MGDRREQVERTCTSCGASFIGTRARRLCDSCRTERARAGALLASTRDETTVVCRDCGATFTGDHRRRYCDNCATERRKANARRNDAKRRTVGHTSRSLGEPRTCEQCGRTYSPRHVNQGLCSDECRRARRSELAAQRSAAQRPPTVCAECGSTFTPTRVGAVYCSKRCNDAVRNRKPEQAAKNWNRRVQRLYGITASTADAMEAAQGSRCLTCGREFSRDGDKRERLRNAPRIDHDHDTGAVRGLLCYWCNVMLGQVDDSPVVLQRMVEYLTFDAGDDPVQRVRDFLAAYPLDGG